MREANSFCRGGACPARRRITTKNICLPVGAGVPTARCRIYDERIYARRGDSRIARPPDLCRAGGVAKQAAVGSAEGGAVKQSEAFLDGVFLSSPILSFARKRRNGKKKKRVPYVGFLSSQEDANAALGQCSFFSWKERAWRERTAFACLKGFWALSPRMVVHSVHFSAPWAIVGHS